MSNKPFRFSLQSFNTDSPASWRKLISKTEDLGYSTFFLADHFLSAGAALEGTYHPPQMLAAIPAIAMAPRTNIVRAFRADVSGRGRNWPARNMAPNCWPWRSPTQPRITGPLSLTSENMLKLESLPLMQRQSRLDIRPYNLLTNCFALVLKLNPSNFARSTLRAATGTTCCPEAGIRQTSSTDRFGPITSTY